ncbi:MAG TPA: hypothetical protein VF720_15505 [Candidatus Eisenbacteria bacterium]
MFTVAGLVTMMALGAGMFSTAHAGFGIGGMFREDADFGIQGRFKTAAGKKLMIVPQFGYFFDDEFFDADVDLHLDFKNSGKMNFYGLGGVDLIADSDFDNTEFGINAGAGLSTPLGDSAKSLFFEAKYVFSDFDGFGLNFGIMF